MVAFVASQMSSASKHPTAGVYMMHVTSVKKSGASCGLSNFLLWSSCYIASVLARLVRTISTLLRSAGLGSH